MKDIKSTAAKNILFYRKQNKLSQKELAEKIGVKHNTISSWESCTNAVDIDSLYNISKVLDIPINVFFGEYERENKDVKESEEAYLYKQLDTEDKAEIRGTMKQMLKADKYTDEEYFDVYTAAKGHGTQHKKISATDRKAAHEALNAIRDQNKNK